MKNKKILSTINLVGFIFLMYASYLFRKNDTAFKQEVVPLFNPVPYAFSIWILIYILLLLWILKGYSSEHDELVMYRKVSLWFLVCMLLCGSSILVAIQISPIIISGALITSLVIYNIIYFSKVERVYLLPFSLLSGWLSVATIVDISEALKTIGIVEIVGIGEIGWTNILLVIGCIIAILFTIRRNDIFYSLVFIWGYIAILVKNSDIKSIQYTAAAMISLIVIGIIYNYIITIKNKKIR